MRLAALVFEVGFVREGWKRVYQGSKVGFVR